MELTTNIELIDLALYLKKEKTLIIADTHIGYEEALNKQGVLIPRTAFKDLIQRLEKILKKVKNFKVHDPDNKCKLGDEVRVTETKPLSKTKRWRLLEIIKKAD